MDADPTEYGKDREIRIRLGDRGDERPSHHLAWRRHSGLLHPAFTLRRRQADRDRPDQCGRRPCGRSRGVAARFVPALAEKTEPIEDKDVKTTERLRDVFEQARKGEVDPELFTDEAKKQLVPLIKGDKDRFASFGALKEFQLLERKKGDDGVSLRYRAVFENETLKVSIALDKDFKIRGVGMQPED